MSELNLKQITDKLNSEFFGENRKLIFWYDENAEFIEDIDSINLNNAKVYHLEKDNQFYTKYFLEREDLETSYLIYAHFPKPPLFENHLADTLRYSKEFFADRASLICLDLGIDEKYKSVLKNYIKFFSAKDRTSKFYNLEIDNWNKNVIEVAMMSVLCKIKVPSFEAVVRTILASKDLGDNKILAEFKKYNLLKPFWRICKEVFGYTDSDPSLIKFVNTIFVTYMEKNVKKELPQSLKNYTSFKSGNILAFLDSMMNSIKHMDSFKKLSDITYNTLNINATLEKFDVDSFIELEIFKKVDVFIIGWLISRLENKDLEAKISNLTIPEICELRRKMHFGNMYSSHYYVIENAYYIIKASNFKPKKDIEDIWKSYISEDYRIDQRYRYFYYHYDKIMNNSIFDSLRELVENIYTNAYLNPLSVAWNRAFIESKADTGIIKQQDFYNKYLRETKERTVVIISDAFRYEVAQTLMKRLMADEKCDAKIEVMQSVVPSITRIGMSALLPHRELIISEDYKVLVDGKECYDLKSREKILNYYIPYSKTSQFDEIKNVNDAKGITTGQDIVYIYHNQIDARGDKLNTENEIFDACEEAVDEIYTMIRRLTSANNIHFIITSDHGFIYKRDKLLESDKISGVSKDNSFICKRAIISENSFDTDGVGTLKLGDILRNDDDRFISFPIGSDIFKAPGGGLNFVHGGTSLQEIIIPVIDVRTNKYHTETKTVSITLVSLLHKITNLTTNIDFIQSEEVTDINKETTFRIYFISDDNEKISDENIYIADKKDKDAAKRTFRLRFNFKNKYYDKNRKYYLVAYDEKNGLEVIRHEVQMDLAFVDDFGFNI